LPRRSVRRKKNSMIKMNKWNRTEVLEGMKRTDCVPDECTHAMVNTSTTPLDLIVLLHESAVDHLRWARFSIKEEDNTRKVRHLSKATGIIEELTSKLDIEEGGDTAVDLQNLYIHMLRELSMADINNDIMRLTQVEALVKELIYAWRQIR
jgi:flagellar protein FliS